MSDMQEQDILIAEKCLGWSRRAGAWDVPPDAIPRFTQRLADAMMLVDAWKGDVEIRRQNGRWKVTFYESSYEHESTWKSKTLSEAICEAALKAWGAK